MGPRQPSQTRRAAATPATRVVTARWHAAQATGRCGAAARVVGRARSYRTPRSHTHAHLLLLTQASDCSALGTGVANCACDTGYLGAHCQFSDETTCSSRGRSQDDGSCVCDAGRGGVQCELDASHCNGPHGAISVRGSEAAVPDPSCACDTLHAGRHCEVRGARGRDEIKAKGDTSVLVATLRPARRSIALWTCAPATTLTGSPFRAANARARRAGRVADPLHVRWIVEATLTRQAIACMPACARRLGAYPRPTRSARATRVTPALTASTATP